MRPYSLDLRQQLVDAYPIHLDDIHSGVRARKRTTAIHSLERRSRPRRDGRELGRTKRCVLNPPGNRSKLPAVVDLASETS